MITIPTESYYAGRSAAVRLVVLHTAESACAPGAARGVAAYLARPDVRASCHYVVDPVETVAQVAEQDTAWTAPGANADGINIEQAGRAAFTASEWAAGAPWQMITTQTVPLVADICRRHGLPAVWLTAADLLAGKRGITDHKTVNEAYAKSDHTDCGHDYPGVLVASMVNDILRGAGSTTEDEDMAKLIKTPDGTVWSTNGVTAARLTTSYGMVKRTGLVPAAPEWGEPVTWDEAADLLIQYKGLMFPMREALIRMAADKG